MQFAVIYNHLLISANLDWIIQAKVAIFIRCSAASEKHFHHWAVGGISHSPTQFRPIRSHSTISKTSLINTRRSFWVQRR
jgi:hypothetical protein